MGAHESENSMLTDFAGVPVRLKHENSRQFALHHRRQVRQRFDVQ